MSVIFENTQVFNLLGAMRAMRNPMNSWEYGDSFLLCGEEFIGEKDLALAGGLIKRGSEHRKFMRQIFVCVNITAPRFWWQEFDTYKVGTVRNSCSTMHKLTSRPLRQSDFDVPIPPYWLEHLNDMIEFVRLGETPLHVLKGHLPEGFLQKATITMNYENVFTIHSQRRNHRLPHWNRDFASWVIQLPYYSQLLKWPIGVGEE